MTSASQGHLPVMLTEVRRALSPRSTDLIVDGTYGLGGHGLALLTEADEGHLLGLDRDPWIIERARERLARERPDLLGRVELIAASHADLDAVLDARDLPGFDVGLLDLGVNSLQIEEGQRGLRREDQTLDLRFDTTDTMTPTATHLLATLPEREIADTLHMLGGERLSRPIARAVVRRRGAGEPVESASDLAGLVWGVYRRHGIRRQRIHPVTRTIQALRMRVNDEPDHLRRGLSAFLRRMNVGARLAVLTFHSGEAREVKAALRNAVKGEHPDLPPDRSHEWIMKGAVKPSREETAVNPRARSAQLRAIRRTG